MKWKVYEVPPIDNRWEFLKTIKETLGDIAKYSGEAGDSDDPHFEELSDFVRAWESAKDAAAELGWEGDFVEEPRVFWLPTEMEFEYAFVFKQENNGTTYVVSPQELPTMQRLM
jgi:hypothetical protein